MEIRESQDYNKLVELFIRNGLENPDPGSDTNVLKIWEIMLDGKIVGGCSLAQNCGEFVLDNLAVDIPYREQGLSKLLLDKVFVYLLKQNAKRLYIVTKIPLYFKKIGFKTIQREEAPDFSECFSCEQYLVDCFPEVMVKYF